MARGNEVATHRLRDRRRAAARPRPAAAHLADRSLTRFETVWCAAGTPNALFGAPLDDLLAAIDDVEVGDIGEG